MNTNPLMKNKLIAKVAGFTFRMYGNGPYFDCDTEGCHQAFPAGKMEVIDGWPLYDHPDQPKFIWDENGSPIMNGEVLNGCPYC